MSHDFIDTKKLSARIVEVKAELAKLLHLESFLGTAAPAKTTKRRGRKPGVKVSAKAPKTPKPKKSKRGNVKASVLAYLEKNREGKAIEIARLSGLKVTSVHQTLYGLKKSGHVTQSKKRGSPFVLAK